MPDSSLRDRILALMRRADYRPMDKVELSKKLNIHSSERRSVRDVLQELETSGAIARIRKDRYILPVKADLVTGRIHFHLNGNAHVIDERTGEPEIVAELVPNARPKPIGSVLMAPAKPSGSASSRRASALRCDALRPGCLAFTSAQ